MHPLPEVVAAAAMAAVERLQAVVPVDVSCLSRLQQHRGWQQRHWRQASWWVGT
jgi:hypothetical protein